MTTIKSRQIIDTFLGIIGQEGLSGIKTTQDKPTKAIAEIAELIRFNLALPYSRIVHEFRRQDLATFEEEPNGIRVRLTVKGIHRIQRAQLATLSIPTPEVWDHMWRMVLFDIPARHADSRYILTSQLKRLGFVMIQRSMWLHPYPCFEQVSALLQYANLQPFATLAEISRIDTASEQRIRKHFPDL